MHRSNAVTVYYSVILISLPESAAAEVVGTKRPSGNDAFREMLMNESPLSRAAAPSQSSTLASLQTKRPALDDSDSAVGPIDWRELTTHQGRTYFMHVPTGRGQWNRPALLADAQEATGGHEAKQAAASGAGDGSASAGSDDPAT
jgi:hypothetical protein